MRTKHSISKQIAPKNTAEENRRMAQLGEFADDPLFDTVFCWRFLATLHAWQERNGNAGSKALGRKDSAKLDKEIGRATREAIARGDEAFLDRLARITGFIDGHYDWDAKSFDDVAAIMSGKGFRAVDPVRYAVAQAYFFTWGRVVDEAKKTRKSFMPYIAKVTRRVKDGAFEKAFDRACEDLGIELKKRK